MKNKNRIINLIICTIILSMICLLCGCGKKTENKEEKYNGMYIYYLNDSKNKLINDKYKPKKVETIDVINEIVEKLSEKTISKKVEINSFNLLDGILTVDFNDEYTKQDKATEILTRAAIVLTLSQVESVDYVAITINDEPLMRSDGDVVGSMQPVDFVDGYGSENNIDLATKFVLYYGNSDGSKLKEYDLVADYTGEQSKEEFIVKKILEGIKEDGYSNTVSSDVELIDVMTTDNICYVNFGSNFLTAPTGISPEIVIYSIVNSLSELNYVHKVQICVNGATNVHFNGISLESAFIRNLDYVEAKEGE